MISQANLRRPELCKVAKDKVASARRAVISGHPRKPKTRSPPVPITNNPAATATVAAAPNSSAAVPTGEETSGADGPKYRDRAQERRRVHNQPEVPILNPEAVKNRYADAPEPVVETLPAPPVEPGRDETNVGNKLLKKMGWSEGAGLGAEGEGRAEPVYVAP